MKEYIIIQLKDMFYYDDNFEIAPFIVEKDENFEEKFNKLVKIAEDYEDFNEVTNFIYDNFKLVNYEKRIVKF